MTDDELQRTLGERRQELFNLRFQSATGALDNSARLDHGGVEVVPDAFALEQRAGAGSEAGDRTHFDRPPRAGKGWERVDHG